MKEVTSQNLTMKMYSKTGREIGRILYQIENKKQNKLKLNNFYENYLVKDKLEKMDSTRISNQKRMDSSNNSKIKSPTRTRKDNFNDNRQTLEKWKQTHNKLAQNFSPIHEPTCTKYKPKFEFIHKKSPNLVDYKKSSYETIPRVEKSQEKIKFYLNHDSSKVKPKNFIDMAKMTSRVNYREKLTRDSQYFTTRIFETESDIFAIESERLNLSKELMDFQAKSQRSNLKRRILDLPSIDVSPKSKMPTKKEERGLYDLQLFKINSSNTVTNYYNDKYATFTNTINNLDQLNSHTRVVLFNKSMTRIIDTEPHTGKVKTSLKIVKKGK